MKILYENKHTNEGLTKAERHNRHMDRIFQDKRDRDARMSKFLIDNSDITDDELKKVQGDDNLGLELKNRGLHDRYWNEVEGKNESLKRNPKLIEAFYRGAKGVEFVGHGEWSDPELIYNGYSFNYWDIENALWHDFLEETGYSDSQSDDPKVEAEFDKYVQDRATDYLDDCIFGGAGTPIDESLKESYTEVDTIECGEDTYRVVGGGFNPTAEALITVEDEEGNRTRMHISDVIEFYTWYDRNGNVIHEPNYDEELDEAVSLKESISEEDRINALANYLGIDADEISNIYDYEYETPEGDYLVVDEYEAEELARDDIENFIDELGIESFTEEFRYWIENNALNTDWFEDVVAESMEAYADDIEDEAPSDDRFENRLEEEMYEAEIIDDEDLEDGYDFDSSRFDYIEMLISNAGDPIDYCRDNFGSDWVSQAAKQHNLYDIDEIVDECIKWDGIAHFIARYDGKEHELGSGLYAYRTN